MIRKRQQLLGWQYWIIFRLTETNFCCTSKISPDVLIIAKHRLTHDAKERINTCTQILQEFFQTCRHMCKHYMWLEWQVKNQSNYSNLFIRALNLESPREDKKLKSATQIGMVGPLLYWQSKKYYSVLFNFYWHADPPRNTDKTFYFLLLLLRMYSLSIPCIIDNYNSSARKDFYFTLIFSSFYKL